MTEERKTVAALISCGGFSPGALIRVLIIVLLASSGIRQAPLLNNRDDFVRYYFGGYVALTYARGQLSERTALDKQRGWASSAFDPRELSRYETALTPYSPLSVFLVWLAEGLRPYLPSSVSVQTYILSAHTVWWVAWVSSLLILVLKAIKGLSAWWVLWLCIVMGIILPHTPLLNPVPRALSVVATAAGICFLVGRKMILSGNALLALASLFHPYQQGINLAVMALFGILAFPHEAMIWAKDQRMRFTAIIQTLILAACYGLSQLLTPTGLGGIDRILGSASGDQTRLGVFASNLSALWFKGDCLQLFLTLVVSALATGWHAQRRGGIRVLSGAMLLSFATLFLDSGYYRNEYLFRFLLALNGMSFVALLFWNRESLRFWIERMALACGRACQLTIALVIGLLVLDGVRYVERRIHKNREKGFSRVERVILETLADAPQP